MASITILNSSGGIISFSIFYNLKGENNMIEKFSSYFSTIQYKTLQYPDNSTNVTIMVRIEKDNYIPMWASSLHFDTAITKYYQFTFDINYKYGLFEIPQERLNNLKFINLKNKSSTKIKSTLTFTIAKQSFTQKDSIIKKNRNLYILIPINSKYISLTISTFIPLKNSWVYFTTIESIYYPLINKYYEITSNIFNTSFKLNEVTFSKNS